MRPAPAPTRLCEGDHPEGCSFYAEVGMLLLAAPLAAVLFAALVGDGTEVGKHGVFPFRSPKRKRRSRFPGSAFDSSWFALCSIHIYAVARNLSSRQLEQSVSFLPTSPYRTRRLAKSGSSERPSYGFRGSTSGTRTVLGSGRNRSPSSALQYRFKFDFQHSADDLACLRPPVHVGVWRVGLDD